MIRRCFALFPGWFHRNRPPGYVVAFLSFFIVCYIVIVRLDTANRVKVMTQGPTAPPGLTRTQTKLVRVRTNIIPPQIMEEFEKDHAKESPKAANYDYYDDVVNTTEDTDIRDLSTGIYIQTENERILQEELEQNEQVIDDNWDNFLNNDNKKKSNSLTKDYPSEDNSLRSRDSHKHFQGILGPVKDNTQQILKSLPKYVNIFDPFSESTEKRNSINDNTCILLKTLHGNSPICIHDPEFDEVISAELSKTGAWEPNYLYTVGSVLRMEPDMMFLDLGCNIGVYTILAAKLGHKVVALDPNRLNLRLLAKSLGLGALTNKVTLLCNAISNEHENVTLSDIIGNVGATFVETAKDDVTEDIDKDKTAYSITLDDLVPMFKDKELFIKMDVETYELRALQGGEQFFEQVNVRYILMEWLYHKRYDSGKEIIDIMTKYKFYPHVNAHHNTKLEPEFYKSWPGNVMWIKY
ncbi:hypothetical protein ACF0H5_005215 [Mactra antiquata]